ncbi:MAG: glucose-6-phosphate dehydrogenase assembly protein OpcA [Akkermansiaceae bacterium]
MTSNQDTAASTASDLDYSVLGKEVSIGSVDKELHLLWDADDANTNASLINFAVYSEEKGAILRNSSIVQEITREHACRAILIDLDYSYPETTIRAWIMAHCNLSGGTKSVCCEQIAFQLKGQATGRLRNTVFAHLNSDLPLVFWWQGELSQNFNERLYSLIDRFVYDSAEWAKPLESFRLIQAAINDSERFLPMDFEWTRSYQMRLAIAGLFDDPLAGQALDKINRVHIVVHPDHQTAGLQLLAWITKRLEWVPSAELNLDTKSGNQFHFESAQGVDISAILELSADSAPVGLLEIASPECTVSVSHDKGSDYLHQKIDAGCHQVNSHTPATGDSCADLVMDQLSRGGKNTLYRSMLPAFIDLLAGN